MPLDLGMRKWTHFYLLHTSPIAILIIHCTFNIMGDDLLIVVLYLVYLIIIGVTATVAAKLLIFPAYDLIPTLGAVPVRITLFFS